MSESNSCIIIRKLACLGGVGRWECNTVVDVKDAVGSAGWPDDGGGLYEIFFSVDITIEPLGASDCWSRCALFSFISIIWWSPGIGTYSLRCRLRKEVRGHESSGNSSIQSSPAMVGSVNHRVLESSWVLQAQVYLALLGFIGLRRCGANIGLERIETKCHDLMCVISCWFYLCGLVLESVKNKNRTYSSVSGQYSTDGSLRAAVSGSLGADDGDLVRWWSGASVDKRRGDSQSWENKSSDELHVEDCK